MPDPQEAVRHTIAQAEALLAQARASSAAASRLIREHDLDPDRLVAGAEKRLGPNGKAEFQAMVDAELQRIDAERAAHRGGLPADGGEPKRRSRKLHGMV